MKIHQALLLITFFAFVCSDITYNSAFTYTTEDCFAKGKVSSSKADKNVILVKDGGNFSMLKINVNKTGDTSDLDNANSYGINAAVLAINSESTISESEITTNGKGAHALFAYGEKSKIKIAETTVTTKGSNSGLLATNSGTINPYRLEMFTSGESSPSFETNNNGVLICENCKASTEGKDSPIFKSKGTMLLEYIEASALNSQMIVIDGPNTVKIRDSEINSFSNGETESDLAGILIYQSTERDANEGRARFTAVESRFTIFENSTKYETAPMFYVTNTKVDIIFLGFNSFVFGSGVFLKVESNENWGTNGKNGGEVALYAYQQSIEGDIICGANSTISIYLTDNSELKGKITIIDNGVVNIYVGGGSKWTLTGDSKVTNYQVDQLDKGDYTLTGTAVTNLEKILTDFPESTIFTIESISDTRVTCSNNVPSENNGGDDDDDDDDDDDGDGDDGDGSSKAKFLYINFLSLLFLILNL